MTTLKKKKKQNNSSFILSVCLMLALIVGLMVPTAVAWFTDSDTGSSNTPINFGTVDINVEQNADTSAKVEFINLNSSARALNAVLPGDSIEFSFNVINAGNVDTYAKVNFAPKIMYGETDITPLLYDTTTDPVNQPYWIVDNTNITTDNPDFYTGGDQNNQVFVLATSETKQIKGVLQFSTKLPNSVTDGTNPPYQLNGHEKGKVKLILDIDMAAIQKDNIELTPAVTELNKHVDSMAINYSFTYLNGNPTLTVAGKPVETEPPYEVGATEDTKAYAFVKEINGKKTLLAVVGEGDMDDYTSTTQPWKDVRSNITEVIVDEGITSIGDYAFDGCSSLTSVVIPNSVQTIGGSAFSGCTSLTSIVIPNSVQSIGGYAFASCTSLTSVVIPNSVQSIGEFAFQICRSLTSIVIPNSVQAIGNYAFFGCTSLTSVVIPDSVQSIGIHAFWGCTSLTSIVIPDSVQSIGNYAFEGCTSLTSIVIPDSVQFIGSSTFAKCSSLTSITVEASNTTYYSENNCLIEKYTKTLIAGCQTSVIPNDVKAIGNCAFRGRTGLTSVVIPNSVQSIGDEAFANCSSLTSIVIPDSVQSIGDFAFRDCKGLTSIVIPDSVQSIGAYAFFDITRNQTIFMEHTSRSEISSLNSNWLYACQAKVVWFSETNQAGYWHYDSDGTTPVLW